jgi:hypothetical protein
MSTMSQAVRTVSGAPTVTDQFGDQRLPELEEDLVTLSSQDPRRGLD